MIDKIAATVAQALSGVEDGSTILIGGFGTAGIPNELIDGLIEQGAKELTVVNNNAGNGDTGLAALLKTGRVRKIVCSFPRQAGGAMDLAIGAKQTWVMMDLLTRQGESKVVAQCSYPLTGIGCVKRIYTDLATLECTPQGLRLVDTVEGLGHAELEKIIGLPIAA